MSTTKKKHQQQQVVDDTSIPKSVRRILAMCPKQELRPVRLTKWAEELVTESRRSGISNNKIAYWIEEYATANNWSDGQIDTILADWKLKTSSSGGGIGGGGGSSPFEIEDLQDFMESLTGLDESDLIRAESRDDLERKSRAFVLQTVVTLKEYDINHWLAQFRKLATIIDVYSDSLSRRKMELKRSTITE